MSSMYGHYEMVKLLLANGAVVDQATNGGYTSLLTSSMEGHQKVVKLLLANGANVFQTDNDGFTPLAISREERHPEVTELLLARIATVRRFTVLAAIRQVRLRPPAPPPS